MSWKGHDSNVRWTPCLSLSRSCNNIPETERLVNSKHLLEAQKSMVMALADWVCGEGPPPGHRWRLLAVISQGQRD